VLVRRVLKATMARGNFLSIPEWVRRLRYTRRCERSTGLPRAPKSSERPASINLPRTARYAFSRAPEPSSAL
jgi:hypothetical protein